MTSKTREDELRASPSKPVVGRATVTGRLTATLLFWGRSAGGNAGDKKKRPADLYGSRALFGR